MKALHFIPVPDVTSPGGFPFLLRYKYYIGDRTIPYNRPFASASRRTFSTRAL
jgi:hypothetical protein